MIDQEHETRPPATGPGLSDAVTFSFADAERQLFGMARLGVGAEHASALALLMRGREPVGVLAEGGLPVADEAWASFSAAGLRATVRAPFESWGLGCEGDAFGLDLVFDATSAPGEMSAVAGTEGYEQLCRVRGTVRAGEDVLELDGVGQRGHSWGAADWAAIELTRSVSAWLPDGRLGGAALAAVRPTGVEGHAHESVAAIIVEDGEAVAVADPRLSTTYDGDGHMRRVGLELWVTEDGYPLRAAGDVLCGTSLDLGTLALDVAFVRWHAEGHEGVGRYEIVRRS